MGQRERSERISARDWLSNFGPYVLLVLVAVITLFLVILALSPRDSQPTSGAVPMDHSGKATNSAPSHTSLPTETAPAADSPSTVVFLGDSDTAGEGLADTSRRWSTLLSRANGWTEVNVGKPETGYATPDSSTDPGPYTSRIEEIVDAGPDVVVVSGGRFDFTGSSSADEVRLAIAATYSALAAGLPNATIIAIGPVWDGSAPPARLLEITAQIRAAVEAVGGHFLEIGQPFEGKAELVTSEDSLPNEEGHRVLYGVIAAALPSTLRAAA